ncbi:hypothetical protein BH11BAC5_BH11BAC5_22460 [soil metagenome]
MANGSNIVSGSMVDATLLIFCYPHRVTTTRHQFRLQHRFIVHGLFFDGSMFWIGGSISGIGINFCCIVASSLKKKVVCLRLSHPSW